MAGENIQENVDVALYVAPETTFGTAALAGASARTLRRVSSTLNLGKDAFSSNEVRPDMQVADARHGTRRVAGGIEAELSIGSFDSFFEAALRGTWVAGGSWSDTEFGTLAASASNSRFTASTGNPVTAGLKIGDVIQVGGAGAGPNANRNFRVTGFGGTSNRQISVTPAPENVAAAGSFTIAVRGKKLLVGTQKRSFTIEERLPTAQFSTLYTGLRVGSAAVRMPPTGMATVGFEFQGKDGQVLKGGAYPYFTGPQEPSLTGIASGLDGSLRLGGVERGIVTGLDIAVALNLSSTPVVGSKVVPNIFYGRTVITGNVSVFVEDSSVIEMFTDETEVDIVTVLETAGVGALDFAAFNIQRAKLMGNNKTINAEGGVIASMPFQALLKAGGPGTPYDQSSMVIQTSAAL